MILIICFQTLTRSKVFQLNINYSFRHYSFICIQLNHYNYCYQIPIILFCIQLNSFKYPALINLFAQLNGFKYIMLCNTNNYAYTQFQVLLLNTNNSIQHYSFVFKQLSCSKYSNVSLPNQLNITHLFTQS